jgi:hypothetical protein
VQNLDGALMRPKHLAEFLVHLRRLVCSAALEDDPFAAMSFLTCVKSTKPAVVRLQRFSRRVLPPHSGQTG